MNTQYKALIITILASLLLVGCDHGSRQAFAESIKRARTTQADGR